MGSEFRRALAERNPVDHGGRRWIFVPYDQLTDAVGPLAREAPADLGIVLVENPWKAARRPYHRQKLALVLTNLRHFALEQAGRGVAVRHVVANGPYRDALSGLSQELGPLRVMDPAERELRTDLAPLVESGALEVLPNETWMTTPGDFDPNAKGPPWRMDAFYRRVRRRTGLLMDAAGKPQGGKWSFDAENRRRWKGDPPAPEAPRFEPDAITSEVVDLVESAFGDHPGQVDAGALPATVNDAEQLWRWALEACLEHFGPYEDAMSVHSSGLFHTRISPLVNLGRLLPARVVADVAGSPAPLASREGFIRQVIGWREFVRHVHRATDGFRIGFPGAGEDPNALGAREPLPPAFWGRASGLACLDRVVADVWREAWSHHITRLMILCNVAALIDAKPREVSDWFWVAYADAYDWVVEPNVLAMGLHATGDVMTTKPYVCGAGYVNRMSDYCRGCRFDPKRDCPLTPMYWAYLARHEAALAGNPRLSLPLRNVRGRSEAQRTRDEEVYQRVRARLAAGKMVGPGDLPEPV